MIRRWLRLFPFFIVERIAWQKCERVRFSTEKSGEAVEVFPGTMLARQKNEG